MNPPARSRSSSAQRAGRPHASSSASARPEQEPTRRQASSAGSKAAFLNAVSRRRKTTSSTEDEPLKKSTRFAVCVHHAPLPVAGSKNSCHSDFPPLTPLSPTTQLPVRNSPLANGQLSLTVCRPPRPLSQFAEAWQMLPGVSEWVMKTIKNGYTLQFFRRPPRFNGVLMSTVREQNASILQEEIHNLLGKCAVEKVPLADRESGFYSRYFLVSKKDGGLRPILDLRPLNRALSKRPFKMITLKQILSHQSGMRILNYLDDWLILAQSESALRSDRRRFFAHLQNLGLTVNMQKSILVPTQNISFLGVELDSINMRTRLTKERAQKLVSSLSVFKGLSASVQIGAPAYETAPALAKEPCATECVKVTHECLDALTPWRDMTLYRQSVPIGQVIRRKTVRTDALSTGWGAVCDGRPAFGTWTETENWPKVRKYAFPPVKLLPQVLCKVRQDRESVLLVAPKWPNQPWFPELVEMLIAPPPWIIPLSQCRSDRIEGERSGYSRNRGYVSNRSVFDPRGLTLGILLCRFPAVLGFRTLQQLEGRIQIFVKDSVKL
ncbi:Protein P [Labeo rohita]|uniref:ribonuclease H n=1 Tax=Labeo rohita TaxID=84645 RepID=A0ABQ8L213_LABRO|nr:Protein P [Labeo rohita]